MGSKVPAGYVRITLRGSNCRFEYGPEVTASRNPGGMLRRDGEGYKTADGRFQIRRMTEPTRYGHSLKTIGWLISSDGKTIGECDTFSQVRDYIREEYSTTDEEE